MLLAKNKQGILTEYAWDTKGCGEPCPNAKLALHELLTIGGDVFEETVPEEEKNPEPPERTEEEQKIYDEKEKEKQEEDDRVRIEVARRKKLIARHDNYVLTRMHHRYDAEGLPKDIELKEAPHIVGGVDIPRGADGVMPQGSKTGGDKSTLQVRFAHLHPNKKVINCENPERYRWGKPPRTYRGARKIWVANQLATRDRTKHKPTELTLTAVPELGIKGVPTKAEQEAAEKAAVEAAAKEGDCDCRVVGERSPARGVAAALGLLAMALLVRRRR
jgi:MYXO-CTERM domain-containing protein